jgi:hypothetical protein
MAPLAHRCYDVAGELLNLEQLDGEFVEGVVALVQPLEQRPSDRDMTRR